MTNETRRERLFAKIAECETFNDAANLLKGELLTDVVVVLRRKFGYDEREMGVRLTEWMGF